ncbi:MAG TPA: dihydrofolate reductase [Roseiarcus sp.]|nr:dihydrofolate reductase [Roseiarcus sp.]
MDKPFRIEGHAIVSEDGMVAAADGLMPNSLVFPSDKKLYEQALDRATIIANGRLSYEGQANSPRRRRLVLTRSVAGLAPDPHNPNARLWNPAGASFEEACAALGVDKGLIAVVGGPFVFSLFLGFGYDAFHLSHAPGVRLPGGVPVFHEQMAGRSPEDVLVAAGLEAGPVQRLDDGVTMVIWARAA